MVYDVVIAGAGPAGLVAAIGLARAGGRVALLDRPPTSKQKVGESMPAAVIRLIQTLNLVPLNSPPHQRIPGTESIWAGEHLQQDFLMQAGGAGWRLDRMQFERDLMDLALESGVAFHAALLRHAEYGHNLWHLETDNGQKLHGSFIVDATGRRARLARMLSSPRVKGPPLVALWGVGNALPDPSAGHAAPTARTLIESQPDGWWYAAHLPGQRPLAIFHTSASYAAKLRKQPEAWWQELCRTDLIREKVAIEGFKCQPLYANEARSIILQNSHAHHWAACGDAALSFDPLSSQGIFNAMATADMLCTALLDKNRESALAAYHQQLMTVVNIYQQRRQSFYRRAQQFHNTEFWHEQLPC